MDFVNNARTKTGITPLHEAASGVPLPLRGQRDTVNVLVDEGADVNSRDVNGQTPLQFAASNGRSDKAELLITKGANVSAKNKWGRTPLDIAVDRGYTEIVELLRKHGAKE